LLPSFSTKGAPVAGAAKARRPGAGNGRISAIATRKAFFIFGEEGQRPVRGFDKG
jgi:hypothetical protein